MSLPSLSPQAELLLVNIVAAALCISVAAIAAAVVCQWTDHINCLLGDHPGHRALSL